MKDLQINNWKNIKQHHIDWWENKGLVLHVGVKSENKHKDAAEMIQVDYWRRYHTDVEFCYKENINRLNDTILVGDTLPIAMPDLGTVSLAAYLGAEPDFDGDTVWYRPNIIVPENHPSLKFNGLNKWWKTINLTIGKMSRENNGKFLIGCPALTPGIDCLAALRGTEELLMDLIDRPDWVKWKLREIDRAYFDAYQRIYDLISLDDGSSAFGYFSLWGLGKTSQVQCDVSAMFSPDTFAEFVVPQLQEQCKWLDNAMYHLDGTQCLCHLDQLLAIPELKAIEWTPQYGLESGGNPKWYDLYRKILDAGKSVQIIDVEPQEVIPLIDAVGSKGVYIMTYAEDTNQALRLVDAVERKRF